MKVFREDYAGGFGNEFLSAFITQTGELAIENRDSEGERQILFLPLPTGKNLAKWIMEQNND